MRNEEFLTKLAKQYVKEAGEKYKLENDELAQSPTSGMDAKIRAARRRQKWQQHRLTFMGVAASIIVIIIAGIAFLPDILRERSPTADMAPQPWATTTPAPAAGAQMAPAPPPGAPLPPPGVATPMPTAPTTPPLGVANEAAIPMPDTPVTVEADSRQRMYAFSEVDLTIDEDFAVAEATADDIHLGYGHLYDAAGAAPATPPAPPVAFGAAPEVAEEPEMFSADMQNLPAIRPNQAIINFSQNMFNQMLATGDENAVISPLSAYYVLAMASQGAAGQTLQEFDQLLGFHSFQPREMLNLTQNLTRNRFDTIVNIAGSVWIRDDQAVNTTFNQAMEAYFGAPANSRNFFAPGTIPEINRWVYDNTEGLIDSIVEEFDPDDVMLLINALYFKGKWPDTMHYAPNTFTTAQGEAIEMDFLSTNASRFQIAVTPQYEAAFLPYNCHRFGFLLVRPTDGADIRDFAAAHSFADIFAGLSHRQSVIQMPGLDFEYKIELNDILQNMGLTSAFDFHTADFSELIYTDYDLKISEVLQKVRITVDRYGTEAAAATAVTFQRSSIPPPPVYLTFNTPYMYAIIDTATGIPLFMGVVDNPS